MSELKKKIPSATRKRFPIYLRVLLQFQQRGVNRVMSYQIGRMCDVEANTVRRDLMYLKHEGKPAYGYYVDSLINAFNDELGTKEDEKIVLIGVGNIGMGLLKYNYLQTRVGKIVCAFEVDPTKINTIVNGVPIYDYKQLKRKFPKNAKIVILAIPGEEIDLVINQLVNLKVKAIINFSDGIPRKRTGLKIHQVELAKIISEIIYEFKSDDID